MRCTMLTLKPALECRLSPTGAFSNTWESTVGQQSPIHPQRSRALITRLCGRAPERNYLRSLFAYPVMFVVREHCGGLRSGQRCWPHDSTCGADDSQRLVDGWRTEPGVQRHAMR